MKKYTLKRAWVSLSLPKRWKLWVVFAWSLFFEEERTGLGSSLAEKHCLYYTADGAHMTSSLHSYMTSSTHVYLEVNPIKFNATYCQISMYWIEA